MSLTDLDRFRAACAYPGELDEQAVERELAAFLRALGMSRRIARLRAGGGREDDPPLNANIERILDSCVKRNLRVRFRPVAALFRMVGAALHLRPILNGDADFALDVLGGGDARAALDARHASDAGAADAALTVLGRGAGFSRAFVVGMVVGMVAFSMVAAPADHVLRVLAPSDATGLFSVFFSVFALLLLLCVFLPLFLFSVLFFGAAAEIARRPVAPARALAALVANPAGASHQDLRGSTWELSWTACALFGAVEQRKPAVEAWLRRLYEAFVAGCWLLYWADDTLYWVAKPTVHREPGTQRLHHDAHAALESDVVNLYFWRGVMVPRFVIVRPDLITIARIEQEENAEVRRVLIERYRHGEEIHGAAAFIGDAGGQRLDHDERYGTLWRRDIPARVIREGDGDRHIPGDEPIVMIEVVNRTPGPDGRFKRYWLRVPPEMRTAREAVAWTFNMPAEQYAPEIET
jgi:hypothetical protein